MQFTFIRDFTIKWDTWELLWYGFESRTINVWIEDGF